MCSSSDDLPSAAFFNPQAKPATEEYLSSLQLYLRKHDQLGPFVEAIRSLPKAWDIFASHRSDIATLNQGSRYSGALAEWINGGPSAVIANAMSGCCALPVLTIVQICQYFQYLEVKGIKHHQLLYQLRTGGVHGYCGGLLPAVAVALSTNEQELVQHASTTLHIALGIGAYGDLGDDEFDGGSTNIVIRLKYAGQGEEIVRLHPGTYISAVTDPKTISIVGPTSVLDQVKAFVSANGLLSQSVHIRGKVHNPENRQLATDLERLCIRHESLRLPSDFKVTLRSNLDGEVIQRSLMHEVIQTILTSRCEWYRLLGCVADDLSCTGRTTHHLVNFGTGDCLSLVPFHQHGLAITKSDAMSIIKSAIPADPKKDPEASYQYPADSIAVVGMACRFPDANNVEQLWDLISSGRSTVERIREDRVSMRFRALQDHQRDSRQSFYGNFIDRPDGFDHAFFGINPREAVYMDPQQRLLLEVSYQAVEASGYPCTHKKEYGDDVGVFIGNTSVDYLANTSSHPPTAYTSTGTLGSFLCGRISHHFGWTGPSEVVDTACSSSLVAINRACKAIQHGECSKALAGGVNVISSIDNYLDLAKAGFLSTTGQCKPFANDADGYCRAEGVGLVFLKSLNQALQDNNQILGVICGAASNQGGLSSSITVPHSPTQVALYRQILDQASMDPYAVSYVEAHGTGTQIGDPLEIASIREVFGGPDRETTLHVGSIKGNIGHCETAAGAAGFIKAILLLQKGILPVLTSHTGLNSKIANLDLDRMAIASNNQEWRTPFRAVCVNSYGAAGSNAAVLLCQPPSKPSVRLPSNRPVDEPLFPFLLSAKSEASLTAYAKDLSTWLKGSASQHSTADVAFTLAEKRQHHDFRWSAASRDLSDLSHLLDNPLDRLLLSRRRSVVLVFCGQVGQTVGASQSLYRTCNTFRYHLDRCNEIVQKIGRLSLFPAIFHSEPISDIRLLQCCLFAKQYACAQCWIDSGLKVNAIVGQSFGELTALAISGHLSVEDTLTLIMTRASIIQSQWNRERGSMLTVRCGVDTAKQLVAEMKQLGKDIEIACYNAEDSLILGGTADAVAVAERLLHHSPAYSGVTAKKLDVTHAYHTRLTEGMLEELELAASILTFKTPTIPLATCTPDSDQAITPAYIRSHMRNPVYFQTAICRLEDRLGDCLWLEAGCDSPAFSVVKRAVASPERHLFQAVKFNDGKDPIDTMASMTSDLWRQGVDVSFWNFSNPREQGLQQVWLPPYHFQETRHWLDYVDHAMQAVNGKPSMEADTTAAVEQPKLITRIVPSDQFSINTSTGRFVDVVTGHSVLGRPLCPAGMYVECAYMAAQQLLSDQKSHSVSIDNCTFELPLGVDSDRAVKIDMRVHPCGTAWSFEVSSVPIGTSSAVESQEKSANLSTHAKGDITFADNLQLQHYQRLISPRVQEINEFADCESLRKDKAYMIFARVVAYSSIFKGITSVKFGDTEALANIDIPLQARTPVSETTATKSCDSISLDVFVQVCGLLINSHSICPVDSAYLAVGADSISISQTCDLEECKEWTVYATFEPIGDKAKGDVFVMRRSGELVIAMTGILFAKIPLKTLGKLLAPSKKEPKETIRSDQLTDLPYSNLSSPSSIEDLVVQGVQGVQIDLAKENTHKDDPTSQSSKPGTEDKHQAMDVLRDVIASYIGLSSHEVKDQASLGALGIDSLASIELADDLSSKYGVQVSAANLLDTNLLTLCRHLGIASGAPGERIADAGQVAMTGRKPVPQALQFPSTKERQGKSVRLKLSEILSHYSGLPVSAVSDGARLEDLGIDSLARIELKAEIGDTFDAEINDNDLNPGARVKDLVRLLDTSPGVSEESSPGKTISSRTSPSSILFTPKSPETPGMSCIISDPFQALARSDEMFASSAKDNGFAGHWDVIAPKYDKVVLAYIVEAFAYLGSDLRRIQPDASVPTVDFLPKHSQVVQCLWDILERQGITYHKEGATFRTSKRIADVRSSQLTRGYIGWHPKHAVDFALMALTGPALADCLTGAADPLKILFGNAEAQQVLSDFYHKSPMLATMTDQLLIFIKQIVAQAGSDILHILEIGAGFGGTTTALAQMLHQSDCKVRYTFTDIAPTLVDKARQRFSEYSWMDFGTLNLDQDPPATYLGKYDIVIATNVVHATKDLAKSIRRTKSLLKNGGFICLSEITKVIDWHNIVFGLLPGWWSFTDGRTYALQPAEKWMKIFKKAGFESTGYSTGASTEAKTQQLLVGSTRARQPKRQPVGISKGDSTIDTVVYKTVDDTDIHADIYFPKVPTFAEPMPIALMIHGGGYMTLSRTAVRPLQTRFLLEKGILPISLDHRLCPEINIIDGPMADVRDAIAWARTELPDIAMSHGTTVDTSKIAVIGWSTGGHLAMTTAWTTAEAGIKPPNIILNFYGPSDFEALAASNIDLNQDLPTTTLSTERIHKSPNPKPLTTYHPPSNPTNTPELNYLHPSDPRSALVLSLFKNNGPSNLSLLLNNLPPPTSPSAPPQPHLDAINPIAQLRKGNYNVPTFIIHGSEDEILPCRTSVAFDKAMKERGVESGVLVVQGAKHIHDLGVGEGSEMWERGVGPGYGFLMRVLGM
ncbi:MAG: hypothetical protein Q9166_004691 [cf. Caloplaca sp. 2 TL-2023]